MTANAAETRREAARDIHSALDALLPRLEIEEMGRLASDLQHVARRPDMLLRVLSFARAMVDEQATPTLTLVGGGHGELIDEAEGARRLDAISENVPLEAWADSDLLGPEAAAVRLGVSRSTLHNWRRDGRVIALRKGLRNHVYPARQFAGTAPLSGIADVLAAMGDPDEAWEWLVTPNAHTEGDAPLALLERGQLEAVRRAADSSLDFA
jgi:hypothetical protein